MTSVPVGSGTSGQSSGRSLPVSFHWRASSADRTELIDGLTPATGSGDPMVGIAVG